MFRIVACLILIASLGGCVVRPLGYPGYYDGYHGYRGHGYYYAPHGSDWGHRGWH